MSPNGTWAKRLDELNRQGKKPRDDERPRPLSLQPSVDFKRAFKFPITPEDSVYVRFSYISEGIEAHKFNRVEANKMNTALANTDVDSFKEQKVSLE